MSGSNHFGSFCVNENVHLKFLNQNWRQFRVHYVRELLLQLVSRAHNGTGLGVRREFGVQLHPCSQLLHGMGCHQLAEICARKCTEFDHKFRKFAGGVMPQCPHSG